MSGDASDPRIGFRTTCFSLVVCQHPETGKFLAVQERETGWWLPGGQVRRGKTFLTMAHLKAQEEAGMQVDITGILSVEHTLLGPPGKQEEARMRVVFFAHPFDPNAQPKTAADGASLRAAWKTLDELNSLAAVPGSEGLRGRELLEWGKYIESGGEVYPVEVLQEEHDGPCCALRIWNTPASVNGGCKMLCPISRMSRRGLDTRSKEQFLPILLRTPSLSPTVLQKALLEIFGKQCQGTTVEELARLYTDALYDQLALSGGATCSAAPVTHQASDASPRVDFDTHGFSVVVCQHPETGKFLAVDESKNRGWWLPAGHVDRGQTFLEAAERETEEEAGLLVDITGILAVEHSIKGREGRQQDARMRIIFFARPKDTGAPPKSVPDSESNGAAWTTTADLEQLARLRPPQGLRGRELLKWGQYVEQGRPVFPAHLLQTERAGPSKERWAALEAGRG
eukprot:CAMPEP_0181304984 /NCGR_PEP_ID=MMETSP1101-20121128/9469_1 /TAXON_ID=46948 /ORGANISM="Rhodomonas abbreviata, Strain Caron Lab Isolate" /LENGTH=454 /DNA_ID=CAMNT_0023410833 /DNA_START=97 /DNA_END=1461 /DNA_ORIENTATION=-